MTDIMAIEHIRPVWGGAQAHLLRAQYGQRYVVKFVNNPQHRRVLANEWLAARLAARLGLPVPAIARVYVSPEFVKRSPSLKLRTGRRWEPCASGVQFGSRLLGTGTDPAFPSTAEVENLNDFAGMLLFDQWTCNCDGRQVIFHPTRSPQRLRAYMVDQGFCFNAGAWDFPDSPLRGLYPSRQAYRNVAGWHSFEPWLSRLENLPEEAIWEAADGLPEEWHEAPFQLHRLLERLSGRRHHLRRLLQSAIGAFPVLFSHWAPAAPVLARAA